MRVAASAPGTGRTALSAILGCGCHFVGLALSAASAGLTTAIPSTPAAGTVDLPSTYQKYCSLLLRHSLTHRTAMRVAASAPGTGRTALAVIFGCGRHC